MKLPLGIVVMLVAASLTIAGPGTIIGLITDILDLSLSIANVVSNGSVYYPEISTLEKEIDAMEKELTPKIQRLDALDKSNNQLYNDMTNVWANNDDMARQTNNVLYLVDSITKALGTDAQLYDQLALDFEYQLDNLIDTYKADVAAVHNAALLKLSITAGVDGAKILYQGMKFIYQKVKGTGQIAKPSQFKTLVSSLTADDLKLVTPYLKPRYRKAWNKMSDVVGWWNRADVKKIRGYVKEAGIVVGSLFSLGVSVTVDVIMAKKMRDTMRTTRNDLLDMKSKIGGYIQKEQSAKTDLLASFNEARKQFGELVVVIEKAVTLNGVQSSRIPSIRNAAALLSQQKVVINAYADATKYLQGLDINADILLIIKEGVNYNDPVSRMISSIKRRGLGNFTTQQILSVIAKTFPNLNSYDGQNLGAYRG